MKTIDINNHFTELDRSILEGENAYTDYFNYVRRALDILLSSFDTIKGNNPLEIKALKDFSQKFLNTIEAFRLKYAYDDHNAMLVDLTESSFPNFMEFKKLADDMENKDVLLAKLPNQDRLKQNILDHLIKKRKDPVGLLKQLSKSSYYIRLQWSNLFTEFTPGKLELLTEHKDEDATRTYFYSWGSYDSVTNKPYVYTMVFDNPTWVKREDTDIRKNQEFLEVLKKATHNSAPLKVVASDIDNAYENVKPKVIKRIALGPIHGKYSLDKHPYSILIKKNFSEDDMVFRYQTEVVFSVGEKRTKSFLSKGELRQIFYIDESNKECMDKMLSEIHKYMITTHPVLQHLNDTEPSTIKQLAAPPYVY